MKSSIAIVLSLALAISCKSDDGSFYNPTGPGSPSGQVPDPTACDTAVYENWEDSNYVLPYPIGESYFVGLNHCSSSFHGPGQADQFAVDFTMNIGALITASRPGTVVYVEESGFDFNFPNNLVIVEHDDGTFAQYMHLTREGALVTVGDDVEKGSNIGLSGATGLAGYPHLHFVVTAAGSFEYPYNSIPYNFSNTVANPKGPSQGAEYMALPY